jgi:hypothetical protein
MIKRLLLCAVVLCVLGTNCFADVPVRTEELIYSIDAFNGMHFSQTFCREKSDAIYLLADVDNFMLLRKTLVYYWPLTNQWLAQLDRLNETFDGTIEIEKNGKLFKTLVPDVFLYYNEPGDFQNNWKVFLGEDATIESSRIEKIENEYQSKMKDFQEKSDLYEKVKKAFIDKMTEFKNTGKDTTDLLERFNQLRAPEPPAAPSYQEMNGGKQFIVNLPKGEYSIKLRRADGLVLEGSEKSLVVYSERRENSIGYDIVPSDKWTKPEKSVTPSNVIYVDGTVDLYAVPFLQKEYNEFFYNKTLDNSGVGNRVIYKWEKIKEVPFSRIEKTIGSEAEIIREKKYFVEPMQSSSTLGYKIVPYDPEGAHKYKNYSFSGFHIPIDRTKTSITIRLQNPNDNYYPLSEREIRIIVKSNGRFGLLIFILLPLIIMTIVIAARNKVYSRSKKNSGHAAD